jgi:hypothetical protein
MGSPLDDRFDGGRESYRSAGGDGTLHCARVNDRWTPFRCDTARDQLGFGLTLFGERYLLPAAKACRPDALDMSVAHENSGRHVSSASDPLSSVASPVGKPSLGVIRNHWRHSGVGSRIRISKSPRADFVDRAPSSVDDPAGDKMASAPDLANTNIRRRGQEFVDEPESPFAGDRGAPIAA